MAPMTITKRPRLLAVHAINASTLDLTFADQGRHVLDLAEDIQRVPGLTPLQDAAAFAGVVLSDGGWGAEWPQLDIQMGADTLLLDALANDEYIPNEVVGILVNEQCSPATAWRKYLCLSQADVAARIGISQAAYAQQEKAAKLRKPTREKIAKALGISPALLDLD